MWSDAYLSVSGTEVFKTGAKGAGHVGRDSAADIQGNAVVELHLATVTLSFQYAVIPKAKLL